MDDLLDLDWSSAPKASGSKLPPHAPTSGESQIPLQPSKSPSPGFDLFAKSANGAPNYYSSTPTIRPSTPATAPLPSQPTLQAPKPAKAANAGSATSVSVPPSARVGDAFSSLLTFNSAAGPSKTLSLAERQSQLAEEKRKKAEHERQQFEAHGSFWENLGTQSQAPSRPPSSKPEVILPNIKLPPPSPTWDIERATSQSTSHPHRYPFDFDVMEIPLDRLAPTSNGSGMRTPVSDFDFGDGNDDLLGELGKPKPVDQRFNHVEDQGDDDFVGELGKPPHSTLRFDDDDLSGRSTRNDSRGNGHRRPTSPPPHVVGQIVEMGFSPAQARQALAKTSTGVDVEAALEWLLTQNQQQDDDTILQEQHRREEEERERSRRRRAGPSRDAVKPRTKEEISEGTTTDADKILAQATEIGQSVLSKASFFWNSGKEKAMKVYEEQRKAMEDNKPKDGKPRWMVDNEGFKDQVDEQTQSHGSRPNEPESRSSSYPALQQTSVEPESRQKPIERTPLAKFPKHMPRPKPVLKPKPLPRRDLVEASPSQLQTAASHKSKGNDYFKLGRFSEAEQAYSSAILSLPTDHLFLVPLYNHRAAAKIKLGESASAADDCTVVVQLVGLGYHPSKEAPLPAEFSAEVKLADDLVKAMTKRAQAWELGEKWNKAAEDWEKVMTLDGALVRPNARNMAAEGARRARRMLEDESKAKVVKAASRPPPKPLTQADVSKSQGVTELRKAAQAAEIEADKRFAAKEAVDAKILAWKTGNETNVRVLVSTLHKVLWDEIMGGLKVGLHELVTPKQVKIKYMKVVARLHPDKVGVMIRDGIQC